MSLVRVHNFSISLDGFGAGEPQSLEQVRAARLAGRPRLARLVVAKEAAGDLDVRLGGGASTVRDFVAAGLVDQMHLVLVPIVLGRGTRLWDGLEALEEQYDIETVSSPSGVTHLTLTRRAAAA